MASLIFALKRIDVNVEVTNEISSIKEASHIILPGVGAAKNAMMQLRQKELINEISNFSQPTLGICLGMQLFMNASLEDDTECLGIISSSCKPFENQKDYPVPHMGWNKVHFNTNSKLTKISPMENIIILFTPIMFQSAMKQSGSQDIQMIFLL